ncbi:hypothetical protein GCM10027085_58340 [Spirosoma aerophilum]
MNYQKLTNNYFIKIDIVHLDTSLWVSPQMDTFDLVAARTLDQTRRLVTKMLDVADRIHAILKSLLGKHVWL